MSLYEMIQVALGLGMFTIALINLMIKLQDRKDKK